MNMLKQKPRVAFVTKLWDNFYLKVGYLVTMLIALDPRGIDLAYPTEFERRSDSSSDETLRNFLSFRRETEKFVFCPETNLTQ